MSIIQRHDLSYLIKMVLITLMMIVVKVSVHTEPVVTTEFLIVSDVKVLTLVLKTPLSFTAFWFPLTW